MRKMTRIALGTCAILAAVATSAPAQARVSIGIGLGYPGYYDGYPGYYPGYYYGPSARAVCDPYSRWYDPYRCRYYYAGYGYDDFYYGPVFIDGVWTSGPLRWRDFDGRREFFWHGGWHAGSGFRSGGFRHGRR
jgi:uncharacterized membrane protein YgcG